MKKVFIDGSAGTTGLRIYERLSAREDIELLTLTEEKRKNPACRREMLNTADIAFLCLPDDAARESVAMTDSTDTVIIDTSTAHRTNEGWCYGFPEISEGMCERIAASKRIAVPGCHASGFLALVKPLIDRGIISPELPLSCHSLTGYSGGGKKMIAEYESAERSPLLSAPRIYALGGVHKHQNEMTAISGTHVIPGFAPIVCDFYSGMLVSVALERSQLCSCHTAEDIKDIYAQMYRGPIVSFRDGRDEAGMLSALCMSGKDSMEIYVYGNEERILLTACYDNLGKGASGAAVQCMNLVLGADPTTGLVI